MALYLLPTFLGDTDNKRIFTPYQIDLVNTISIFVVENLRSSRRDLRKMGYTRSFEDTTMYEIGKHSAADLPQTIIKKHLKEDFALMSEAGIPAVADPGNFLVLEAQRQNVRCVPLVGPSSIFLALVASGLNGQNFAFNGYLPIDKAERKKALHHLESRSSRENQTQIFIETPFRNNQLFLDLLSTLNEKTLLTVATGITTSDEKILTKSVFDWKKSSFLLTKIPTIFLFLA
ncbi:MAG: SAM-dependent methyltransferase [Treponemataceae bacterium]